MTGRKTTTPRPRIANACDNCKARKVRCDGGTPCGYCTRRRHPLVCQYTPQRRRHPHQTPSIGGVSHCNTALEPQVGLESASQTQRLPAEDETEVPREGRVIKDAYGKMVFIGDCAPLSLYQSIRKLITTHVDPSAFAHQTSLPSVLQNSRLRQSSLSSDGPPAISSENIGKHVKLYREGIAGIVDLFSNSSLEDALTAWATSKVTTSSLSTVYYLVLAIGSQPEEDDIAHAYFEYAKGRALSSLGADINIETVQSFILITIFLLRACQTNGAFVFFGIAVRSAFSIGLHRTEANALLGDGVGKQRDRMWKSLRIVDLYLSASMGRPPATSDVDCTVSYRQSDENANNCFDSLNAAVQILLISESVVTQVYSRRKITLAITEGISAQLRDWSNRWLKPLQYILQKSVLPTDNVSSIIGACQILATYYYTVMLVSRPFLMYEARQRLATGFARGDVGGEGSSSGRLKLADACIDAAAMLAELVGPLVDQRVLKKRMPILVSWLFASSLVLGLGLVGGFGRILEKYCHRNISSLDYFSRGDAHAMQYSLITHSLIETALGFLEKRDLEERRTRTEKSRQLFGMGSQEYNARDINPEQSIEASEHQNTQSAGLGQDLETVTTDVDDTSMQDFYAILASATLLPGQGPSDSRSTGQPAQAIDLSIFDGLFEGMSDEDCAGINLFPLLDDGPSLELGQPL